MTNAKLVEIFKRFLAERRGYVYGAQGELWSAALAETWIKSGAVVPSGNDRTTYFRQRCARWIGRRVDDCSGGIVDAMRTENPKYGDRNANTFKAQFVEGGPVATIPDIPGLAVWRSGHIGLYIGGGQVIEFRGTDYGCVQTTLSKRDFTHWGKIRDVDYGQAASVQSPATVNPVRSGGVYFAVCGGSKVNIRTGRGTDHTILGVLYKGDRMLALPQIGGWCEVAAETNGKIIRGYMSGQYVREVSK